MTRAKRASHVPQHGLRGEAPLRAPCRRDDAVRAVRVAAVLDLEEGARVAGELGDAGRIQRLATATLDVEHTTKTYEAKQVIAADAAITTPPVTGTRPGSLPTSGIEIVVAQGPRYYAIHCPRGFDPIGVDRHDSRAQTLLRRDEVVQGRELGPLHATVLMDLRRREASMDEVSIAVDRGETAFARLAVPALAARLASRARAAMMIRLTIVSATVPVEQVYRPPREVVVRFGDRPELRADDVGPRLAQHLLARRDQGPDREQVRHVEALLAQPRHGPRGATASAAGHRERARVGVRQLVQAREKTIVEGAPGGVVERCGAVGAGVSALPSTR